MRGYSRLNASALAVFPVCFLSLAVAVPPEVGPSTLRSGARADTQARPMG